MTQIYHYNHTTGAFIAQGVAALDPIDQLPLIPAHATTMAPPDIGENQAAIFDKTAQNWTIVSDYRGFEYWLEDGSKHLITELNQTPPDDALSQAPEIQKTLEEIRAETSVTRAQFVINCHVAGLFQSEGNAEIAAAGDWPPEFGAFLSDQPIDQRIESRAAWRDAKTVHRNAPLIKQFIASGQFTNQQVDALFGID